MIRIIIPLLLVSTITFQAIAQEAIKPRLSPTAIVTMKYEDTYVKITYCQPHKNEREIFGGLVPYGEVWRTGANEATEITITEDIKFGGEKLKAGTYSIFTIPGEKEWTVILNSGKGLWGAYNYDPEKDVLRVKGKVSQTEEVWEAFTISFEQMKKKTDMVMQWDKTRVSLPIEF